MERSMNFAPVVLFVYNRADHFIKTYEALNRCPEAAQSDLYIFSDGARNEKDVPKVEEVRNALHKAKQNTNFQKIEIIESIQNRGLAASVIAGVTKVIQEYGKVIVVEDDCITSPYFLKYMNRCLAYYENNERVGSIAGFTPQLSFPKTFTEDVFFAYRSCSWGWATWLKSWENVDWELKDINQFYKNPQLIKKLNANGSDRFVRLYRQTKGNGSSWSVRFGAHLVKNNQLIVYPRYSYIQNIGCDETGVHSKSEDAIKMRVDLSKAIENPVLCEPEINSEIQKLMKKHYSSGIASNLKRWAVTRVIVARERKKG